jgi:ATP synthase protein I
LTREVSVVPPSEKYRAARQIGLLSTIPLILAVAPLVGYFLGRWLDGRLHTGSVLSVIFLVLGLVAGVRETVVILRKATREEDR